MCYEPAPGIQLNLGHPASPGILLNPRVAAKRIAGVLSWGWTSSVGVMKFPI